MSKSKPSASTPAGLPVGKPIPSGFPARRLAAEAFRRVQAERRSIEEALSLSRIPRLDALMSPADHALARAIVTVAYRRLGSIRAAIEARLTGDDLPKAGLFDAALMTGVAQVLFMDAPDHAAVDLAVEIMKADAKALHYSGLGNAILRRIATEKSAIQAGLSPEIDTPAWLFERWGRAYGVEAARAIAARHGQPAHIDLTLFAGGEAMLREVDGIMLPTGSLRLTGEQPVTMLPGFAEGAFQVQDAAAALPARLVAAKPGMTVLDLCAAPGGKTAQLAKAGASVIAVERSAERTRRLRENLERLGLSVEIVVADVLTFEHQPVDAVLLDAPCSATGTIRRHPEAAWTKTLADVLALARQQRLLLDRAAGFVAPGGRLIYATCSLEREEGEEQIAAFLARNAAFVIEPIRSAELGIEEAAITPDGLLRVLPGHFDAVGGADGFFAARLQRVR